MSEVIALRGPQWVPAATNETVRKLTDYPRLLAEALALAEESRRELADAHRRIAVLEHQSRTDEATGLLNRRGFEIEMQAAMGRVRRKGETGLLVMVDLDGFKQINDTFGHQAGDLVLATVGNVLLKHTRDTDSVARMGGDEFAVILSDAELEGAIRRVRIIDRILNWTAVPWKGAKIQIRASFGWAAYGQSDELEELMERADLAMYDRKRARD